MGKKQKTKQEIKQEIQKVTEQKIELKQKEEELKKQQEEAEQKQIQEKYKQVMQELKQEEIEELNKQQNSQKTEIKMIEIKQNQEITLETIVQAYNSSLTQEKGQEAFLGAFVQVPEGDQAAFKGAYDALKTRFGDQDIKVSDLEAVMRAPEGLERLQEFLAIIINWVGNLFGQEWYKETIDSKSLRDVLKPQEGPFAALIKDQRATGNVCPSLGITS